MLRPKLVQGPLLGRSIGTSTTDFTLHEIVEAPLPPTRAGIPLHRHRTEDEAWYILGGRLRFRFDAEEFDGVAGTGVLLPQGVPHTFWNPGPEDARYLLIVGPQTEALLEALHGPGRTGSDDLRALYDRFGVDLL